jgi:hypothetical protein
MPIKAGSAHSGGRLDCFEGVSRYNDRSSAASFHAAVQQAAEHAARHLRLPKGKTVDFEVTRIQIVVGNPNVKSYRVEITPTG